MVDCFEDHAAVVAILQDCLGRRGDGSAFVEDGKRCRPLVGATCFGAVGRFDVHAAVCAVLHDQGGGLGKGHAVQVSAERVDQTITIQTDRRSGRNGRDKS